MISAHSAAAVRAAEAPLLAAGRGPELMRTASYGLALGVVTTLRSRGQGVYGAKAVLLVGSGNNGGDALFAGAWLAARGARTTALLTGARTHTQALAAFEKAGGRCVYLPAAAGPNTAVAGPNASAAACPNTAEVSGLGAVASFIAEAEVSDVVIDGLLGTGGQGGLREPAAGIVARLQQLSGRDRPAVVACDLPSGVDATTGEVHGPVLRADLTVTFGAYKTGLLNAPGEQFCGRLSLVSLGLEPHLGEGEVFRLEPADLAVLLPAPGSADHKYTRGVAGIIAGSNQYPGAGLLAAAAASACGPGMVRYLGPENVAAALHVRNPEVVCSEDSPHNVHVQAWVVGPGIDGDAGQLQRAAEAIASGRPTVVDAAALTLVAPACGNENAHLLLTPHAGELAALFSRCGFTNHGESADGSARVLDRSGIEAAPLIAARLAAALFGAVVLLKGPSTVVAAPNGRVFTQANGTPRLATAGSGDTLAGILVALLAMGTGAAEPVVLAGNAVHDDFSKLVGKTELDVLVRTAALAAALHGELARTDSVSAQLARQDLSQPLNAGLLAGKIPAVWARLSLGAGYASAEFCSEARERAKPRGGRHWN